MKLNLLRVTAKMRECKENFVDVNKQVTQVEKT